MSRVNIKYMREYLNGRNYDRRKLIAMLHQLVPEVERLYRAEDQHDRCHDLHGKVNARDFANGCTAEQRRLYGCAPDADDLAQAKETIAMYEKRLGRTLEFIKDLNGAANNIKREIYGENDG